MSGDFGIRSVPPCGDCWEDGTCSMNCGPKRTEATLKQYAQDVRDAREKKAAVIMNDGLWP